MEIESRLLPCGLHVVGQPPTAAEAIATLVNIAEIDRVDNDPPIAGLPGILARTIRRNVEEIYLNNNKVPPPASLLSMLAQAAERLRLPLQMPAVHICPNNGRGLCCAISVCY